MNCRRKKIYLECRVKICEVWDSGESCYAGYVRIHGKAFLHRNMVQFVEDLPTGQYVAKLSDL